MPYVDTKKLLGYVQECLPALNEKEVIDFIYSQSGATTSRGRYLLKFGSGKMVCFGDETTFKIKVMLQNLETRTKVKPPFDMFYSRMVDFPDDAEVYRERDARRDQRAATQEKALEEHKTEALQNTDEPNVQAAILAELRAIRELQEETCKFIKTLVLALNGAPGRGVKI